MDKPNRFFIIGAQRSGTTYLYHILDQHPDIEMAKPAFPEPKFFLEPSHYEQTLEEYERHFFLGKTDAFIRGEKSTSYIESESAAESIQKLFPDAKIIAILRNPIHRAISNYLYSVANGVEALSMEEAFYREDERRDIYDRQRFSVSPFAYIKRGCYFENLTMWRRYFNPSNFEVLIFERVVGKLEQLQSLYRWLGTNPYFEPKGLNEQVNADGPGEWHLSSRLERFLQSRFREPTARLVDLLGDPLPEWQSLSTAPVDGG